MKLLDDGEGEMLEGGKRADTYAFCFFCNSFASECHGKTCVIIMTIIVIIG
jgi:hypothetical protein